MSAIRVAVLDDHYKVAAKLADWAALGPSVSVEFFADHLDEESAVVERLLLFDVVAIMRELTPFPRSLLARLPQLRLLVTTGPVNHAVDIQACVDYGITVCGTRSRPCSTVELTWGLIIGLGRHIVQEDRALREGQWQTSLGTELKGKIIGVLGLGRLGSSVAQVARAFGMEVLAWSQNLTEERAVACGATRVDKLTLFERSDIVTVNLLLSERTRGIVGAAELARMKPTAYLINTSRGQIVDTGALIDALHAGRIAGAGIDVYPQEPLPAGDPLFSAPNTLLTPHIGYVTREAYALFYTDTVEDILAWRAGSPVRVLPAR